MTAVLPSLAQTGFLQLAKDPSFNSVASDSSQTTQKPATKTCDFWLRHGSCRHGERCKFVHGPPQSAASGAPGNGGGAIPGALASSSVNTMQKRPARVCDFFMRLGSCRHGDNCKFSHVRNSAPAAPSEAEQPANAPEQPKSTEEAASRKDEGKKKVCDFWNRLGSCRHGAACKFVHGPAPTAKGNTLQQQQQLQAQQQPNGGSVASSEQSRSMGTGNSMLNSAVFNQPAIGQVMMQGPMPGDASQMHAFAAQAQEMANQYAMQAHALAAQAAQAQAAAAAAQAQAQAQAHAHAQAQAQAQGSQQVPLCMPCAPDNTFLGMSDEEACSSYPQADGVRWSQMGMSMEMEMSMEMPPVREQLPSVHAAPFMPSRHQNALYTVPNTARPAGMPSPVRPYTEAMPGAQMYAEAMPGAQAQAIIFAQQFDPNEPPAKRRRSAGAFTASGERICDFFARMGECRNGVNCKFKHVHSSVHQEAAAGGAVICGPVSMNSAEFDQENRGVNALKRAAP